MKILMAGILSAAMAICGSAWAGPIAQPAMSDRPSMATPAAENTGLLRQNNITSTGATVPHPGASQSSGPTRLDSGIERENDRIESICKGC